MKYITIILLLSTSLLGKSQSKSSFGLSLLGGNEIGSVFGKTTSFGFFGLWKHTLNANWHLKSGLGYAIDYNRTPKMAFSRIPFMESTKSNGFFESKSFQHQLIIPLTLNREIYKRNRLTVSLGSGFWFSNLLHTQNRYKYFNEQGEYIETSKSAYNGYELLATSAFSCNVLIKMNKVKWFVEPTYRFGQLDVLELNSDEYKWFGLQTGILF
ncbi:MAG: hypothetical protein EAY81_03500 [Bacteroidetes bacterium]|nr:MAG: hypothetical protein EAY81_03500 [Bacteroidota bacterium]